jgi:hypothetical protein
MNNKTDQEFHGSESLQVVVQLMSSKSALLQKAEFMYTFHNHFHPFVSEFLEKLNQESLEGLFDPDFQENLRDDEFFVNYEPNDSEKVAVISYAKEVDFNEDGAYSVYNWECFFHAPLITAVHLSKNQRFADAQRWFHRIFDPTTNDGQFWRCLAFKQDRDFHQIDELMSLISLPENRSKALRNRILNGYEELRKNPFQPHAIARTRFLAYQYCVVMKYLDNLIAWGDSLFRQDSIETLNEATQVYVLAANLLGPKPKHIPKRGTVKPKTFAQLRKGRGVDELGNKLVELEGLFPFNYGQSKTKGINDGQSSPLFGIARTLYFCLPRNEKLLGYWDTVADRLFKIRHCMNIEGVVRQLPLFQPPIDPGMLVKAAAAGIDISSIVSGLNQPLSPVRSPLLIQKATEICNEVRSLGNALLSALEKQDGEALGLLRQKHEINIQKLAQDVRFLQWKEAESNTEALLKSRVTMLERFRYYQRLLGQKIDSGITPDTLSVDRQWLNDDDNFDADYQELVKQYEKDVAKVSFPDSLTLHEGTADFIETVLNTGRLYLNFCEFLDLNVLGPSAQTLKTLAAGAEAISSVIIHAPDGIVNVKYWGVGADIETPGGKKMKASTDSGRDLLKTAADLVEMAATYTSKTATYQRRADEWILQHNLAAHELMHIGRQIIGSLITEKIAKHEYENLKKQIEHTQEIDHFLHSKFTSGVLYNWMQGELSKLYYEYYKFAFDIARKAEQTMKHELMRPELDDMTFIKFNYWDGGRKGLLSGEALHLDLKRMEMAYHEHNKREYELTKHISLRQLDPIALLDLKATGSCEIIIPEWLFDLNTPGHYMRRIKTVSLSIPAVTSPYTNVNCTLSLHKSTLRKSSILREGEYRRVQNEEDNRFIDYYGTIQSIVTSNAQNDSGLFETNLRDERFLPFEGHGVVSSWKLELPEDFRQFDYNTISDVVLHMRYTARQGGGALKKASVKALSTLLEDANQKGLTRLFSLNHEFPTEWHQSGDDFMATVKKSYFPFFAQGKTITIDKVELHTIQEDGLTSTKLDFGLDKETELENYLEALSKQLNDSKAFELSLSKSEVSREKKTQVFMVIHYSLSSKQA